MVDITKLKEQCSGCSACANICPVNAIEMNPDDEGFLYPNIDFKKCINCSKCNSVCQIDNSSENNSAIEPLFFAMINKNDDYLRVSSSGGAFLALAESVISKNGIVIGCAFNEQLKAVHIGVDSIEDCIDKLCGSKYVQSDIGDVYLKVKDYLQGGRYVMFTGTPCQVEGLKLFLKKEYDNLLTVDLICHGVCSPLLWDMHLQYLSTKAGAKIHKFRFRGKEEKGWGLYYYYYYYGNNKIIKGPSVLDRYYTDFLKGKNFRESCYRCRYAKLKRTSDCTIGDFHGVRKIFKDLDRERGVSLLVVNTDKGKDILNEINNQIICHSVTKEQVCTDNLRLVNPTKRPDERNDYYVYAYSDFETWEKKYIHTKNWYYSKIKSMIPIWIKQKVRR